MTRWRFGPVLLAFWVVLGVRAFAADKAPFTIAELKAAWEARQNRFERVEAKWTAKQFRPRGAISDLLPPPLRKQMGFAPDAVVPPADFTKAVSFSLLLDGGKARWREEGRYAANGVGEERDHWSEACFDGRVFRNQRSIHKPTVSYPQGSVQKNPSFSDADNVDLRPLVLYYRPMHRGFAPLPLDAFLVTGQSALISGRQCAAIAQPGRSMTIWIDHEADFVIRRLVVDSRARQGAIFQFDIEYAEADGFRPTGWTYREHTAANRLMNSSEATGVVSDHSADFGKDAFVLSFLPRAYVFDALANESYLLREDGSKRIVLPSERKSGYENWVATDPGNDAPQGTPSFGFSWLALLAGCGGVALICLLWRAYSRVRTSDR